MRTFILYMLVFFTCYTNAFALWDGPQEVASFNYGSSLDSIGISHSDYDSEVKSIIDVDYFGNILVGDQINKKVFLVNNKGFVKKVILPKVNQDEKYIWPRSLFALDESSFLVSSGSLHQVYSYDSELLYKFEIEKSIIKHVYDDYSLSIYSKYDKSYKKHTKYGDFIETISDTWFFKSYIYGERIDGKYSYQINYPENETGLLLPYKTIVKFSKSQNATYNIHVSNKKAEVANIDSCGKLLGSFKVPEDVFSGGTSSIKEGREDIPLLLEGYGNPIFGKDGNVYTWKQTPDTYSILKWEWVDDPSDPQGGPEPPSKLAVQASLDGLLLTWGASPQDPGCVDSYEVERATSIDGIYSSIGSTDAGILRYNDPTILPGETVYYKVRAKSGGEYSDYTAVASGKRL